MGMSASQARLLSLTSRIHDLEYQAQTLQYSKLDLTDLKNEAYEEYLDTLNSTKYQLAVLTTDGTEYQDITYQTLMTSTSTGLHSMYMLTDSATGKILLPEQITAHLNPMPNTVEEFLEIVGEYYLYTGRTDLESQDDIIAEMKSDGNYDYWYSLYYLIGGYEDDTGNIVSGKGYIPISQSNATDRDWLEEALNSGEVLLYKMTDDESYLDGNAINIFEETSMSTDSDMIEVEDEEVTDQAAIKYEKAIDDIDTKDTKLDLQLAQIETEHDALETEYDSVKQIMSKSIERSFKSFNA